jgi:hypothetical protein
MKKIIFILAAVSVNLFADTSRPVKFTLPVPVTISTVAVAPGECSMDTINSNTSSTMLVIRCADGTITTAPAMRVMRGDGRAADRTELILRNADGKSTIHKVWLAGEAYGFELLSQ